MCGEGLKICRAYNYVPRNFFKTSNNYIPYHQPKKKFAERIITFQPYTYVIMRSSLQMYVIIRKKPHLYVI